VRSCSEPQGSALGEEGRNCRAKLDLFISYGFSESQKDATKRGRGAKAFYSAGEETFKSYIVYSRNTR
jgi:hypothetical protein